MKGIIYCAISPSNKKYYGYSINFEQRKRWHYRDAIIKNGINYFHKALRKYGFENFIWNIIEEHERETKIELHGILCEREIYWILKDKTYLPEFGYNMTKGGDGVLGYKFTKEQYKKVCKFNKQLTDKQKNIPRTKETKDKMSLAKKGKTYKEIYGEKAEEMKDKRRNQKHTEEEEKENRKLARKKLELTPEYKEMQIKRVSGEKNPMFKKTVYDIWVKKYGKQIADKKYKSWKDKISKTTRGKSKPRKLVKEYINYK